MTASAKPRISPYLVLAAGIFAVSFGSILARLAQEEGTPSLVIAAYRTLVATLILLPFMLMRHRDEVQAMTPTDWRLALVAGMALAVHFATWISSLSYTSIAASTVLVSTSPLWVALVAPFFLGEPFTRWLKIGMVLALVGTVIISLGAMVSTMVAVENGRLLFNTTDLATGQQPLLGNTLALIGSLGGAVYILIGRKLRTRLSLTSYATLVYGTAAVCLVLVVWLTGNSMLGYSPQVYLLFLLMGIVPQLLGHSSFNYALGYLPAAYVGVVIFAEPIGASLLALFIFGERPGPMVVLGSVFVLVGVLVSSRKSGEREG
ncbi:MAG: EamA family transporter [Aquificales bacterium]|nr:EamA family transporter [Aquificales bacterium]